MGGQKEKKKNLEGGGSRRGAGSFATAVAMASARSGKFALGLASWHPGRLTIRRYRRRWYGSAFVVEVEVEE